MKYKNTNLSAKVILCSENLYVPGARIYTFELEYPRFIHGEFMTHRQFSRNAASSRAIPISKVIEDIQNNPAQPVWYGKKQSGMQANGQIHENDIDVVKEIIGIIRNQSIAAAKVLDNADLHKQITNRILEPYQMIKVIVTTTELNNFFWLRDHEDAQPEIQVLAKLMQEAIEEYWMNTGIQFLREGQWHLPYVHCEKTRSDDQVYFDEKGNMIGLNEARMISASCCAQVSYRKNDGSLEKAEDIFDRLVNSERVHASPTEHQATPVRPRTNPMNYFTVEGIFAFNKNLEPLSGNLKWFVQYRQLIPNNVKED
jgi:hypothetical protein